MADEFITGRARLSTVVPIFALHLKGLHGGTMVWHYNSILCIKQNSKLRLLFGLLD